MKKISLFYSLTILLILSLTPNTIGSNELDIELPSNVLLFENSNPWGGNYLEDILTENSINYVLHGGSMMDDIDFSQYDMVIVNGNDNQGDDFYRNLGIYREKFETYVSMGGVLKITIANQDSSDRVTSTLPGNINSTYKTGNDVIINDNNHTLMNIPNKISTTDLQNWGASYHRIMNEYDDKTNIILKNSADEPILVEKNIGSGIVVISTQTFDHDIGHKPEYENFVLYTANSQFKIDNIPAEISYNAASPDNKISFNITTSNATNYEIYLNDELINSYPYLDNETIILDLNKIYANYDYTNYSIFNDTKFEYTNLTLVFHNAQNNSYVHTMNVTVFDYLPQVTGDTSVAVNYEIGTSLPLKFNVSDDNPDMVYVYSNNILLYSQNWTDNLNIDVSNFINFSNKLGYNYYKVIFEDMDNNQVEYNLQVNVLDTVNPIFTSVFADDYIEGDEFGVISFSVDDVTLDRYAVFANDIELANSTFGNTSYIEISNAGLLAGNYEVEIVVYDRANNIAKITTSFVVESQGVTSTVTVDPPVSNSTVTSDTSTSDDNTMTITETTTETNNVTIQGNNTQNVSVPATLPISDLPLMLFTSLIGLYLFRKNRK